MSKEKLIFPREYRFTEEELTPDWAKDPNNPLNRIRASMETGSGMWKWTTDLPESEGSKKLREAFDRLMESVNELDPEERQAFVRRMIRDLER